MGRSRSFFVLIVLGVLLALIGIGVGASSHSSTYTPVAKGTIAHYLSADGTGYLQMDGSSNLYIVHEGDFSPTVHGTDTFKDGDSISLYADTSDKTNIDKTSTIGTHLVGAAANVVQIVFYDNNGQPQNTYTTSAYTNGSSHNNWGTGGILIVLGLLMVGGSFFLPRKKPQPGFGITPGVPAMGQPVAIPYNMPNMSYQQPYQGAPPYQGQQFGQQPFSPYQQPVAPAPYPSAAANPYGQQPPTQYPPYQGQGGQPINPYGQPQQFPQPQQPSYPQYPTYEPTQRANPYE